MNLSLVAKTMHLMEGRLLDGSWKAGTRLPAERVLAQQFGVSRGTVREAIQRLVARNMLTSRQGSGVFVTDRMQTGHTSPWLQLIEDDPELRDDLLEFRRVLERATAQFAAVRADRADLRRIAEIIKRLEACHKLGDRTGEAKADAELHEAIARASHNRMFGNLHTSIVATLREHIALNIATLQEGLPAVSDCLLEQHVAIWEAIRRHDPDQARAAMLAHIEFVRARLEKHERGAGRNRRPSDDKGHIPAAAPQTQRRQSENNRLGTNARRRV